MTVQTSGSALPLSRSASPQTRVYPPSPLGRYRPLAALLPVYLALSALLRLFLWWRFGLDNGVHAIRVPAILALGLVNDAVEALYLFLPLSLYLALVPSRFHAGSGGRRLMAAGVWLLLFGLLYVCAMEYFFFEEFDARFNLVAVDYLIYPTEVIGDIRDEYPVGPLSAVIAAIAALLTWRLWPRLRPTADTATRRQRLAVFAAHLALMGAAIGFWHADTLSLFGNRSANELADNGPANFFSAFRTNEIDYDTFYRTGDPQAMLQTLAADLGRGGGEFTDLPGGDLNRSFPVREGGLGKMNVVLLSEEAFGAEFVGAYGDARGLTPEFDKLAAQGMLFTRAFATGTRTVRGLEAFSASFPPVPSESILKRPGNEDIATWGKVMQALGYQTSFVYGGYGAFDNMNYYFGQNGFALSDRAEIDQPRFANVWGVSDEDLFHHAVQYFDQRSAEGKPFFSIVMSTSNHKPYTFPEGVQGVPARGGGRKAGVRYADHAIGEFMREAATRPWFKNTVFVIAADHGARVYGKAQIPLNTYEIPILIYAPGRVAAQKIDTPMSQIDVAPTVLGMLGLAYQAPFFGQDVLRWPEGEPRTLLFNHNHEVAALRGDSLCILGLRRSANCVSYQREPGPAEPGNTRFSRVADDAELIDLATAYYQTAYGLYREHRYR